MHFAVGLWRSLSGTAVGAGAGLRRGIGGEAPPHVIERLLEGGVACGPRRRTAASMQDGGVIAPTEVTPDGGQGVAGELPREIHRELSWGSDPADT